jgi:predicted nucleic acid-binding protein
MGNGEIRFAVVDAGPLIHLREIQSLSLLRIFRSLVLPDAVWQETVGRLRVLEDDLALLGNVERRHLPADDVRTFVKKHDLGNLHRGECEALFVCWNDSIQLLLTDDLAVRDAAKRWGVTPVGSLGVIVRGYRERIISYEQAVSRIRLLDQVSTLFVTPAIVDLALEQLAQYRVGAES